MLLIECFLQMGILMNEYTIQLVNFNANSHTISDPYSSVYNYIFNEPSTSSSK